MATATGTKGKPARQAGAKTPADRANTDRSKREEIEQKVADRIIEMLDQGNLPPWEKSWANSNAGQPKNAISKKPYRGINHWLTIIAQEMMGYGDNRWLTYPQAQSKGGYVRKGESGIQIHFRSTWVPRDRGETPPASDAGESEQEKQPRKIWIWKTYKVFNVEQTEGCDLETLEEATPKVHDPVAEAERIIAEMPNRPEITQYETANHAPYYEPGTDSIMVPAQGRYEQIEDWYNTVFHELVHSTGHRSRLGRCEDEKGNVWSTHIHDYGREELVAGMGSSMLGQLAGTGTLTVERNAAYMKDWRDKIAGDKGMVLNAATQAQKAVDYICRDVEQR